MQVERVELVLLAYIFRCPRHFACSITQFSRAVTLKSPWRC